VTGTKWGMLALRPLVPALLFVLALAIPSSASAIVGGETTQRDWPHMSAMEYLDPESGEWGLRCGASLIRSDVILTAAHCVDDEDGGGTIEASRFRFLLGTKKLSAGGERIGAVKILEHPRYDASEGMEADVALVKLARPSTLGRTIRVGGDADEPRWQPGDPAVVTGWGTEFFGSPVVPDDLKEAEVPIVTDDDCQRSYELTLGFDPATNVCAGNLYGGEDSCQGDSGGPLHVQDAAGAWILVGVVSYGLGCAFPTQYGVYAEAGGDVLRGWIASNADAMASQPAPAGSGGATGSSGTTSSSSTSALAPLRTRVTLPSTVRVVRRGRRASVTLRTTAPLRSIAVSLRRSTRVLASGRRASLRGSRGRVLVRPRVRRGLRLRRVTLRVSAIDASGRRIVAQRTVRLRR